MSLRPFDEERAEPQADRIIVPPVSHRRKITAALNGSGSKRRIPMLPVLLLLIVALGATVWGSMRQQEIRQRASFVPLTYSMSPATTSKLVQETFAVGLTANTGDETLTATTIRVTYDPTKLEATGITPGTFLPVVLAPGAITNGQASISLGSEPTNPRKGTGVIATITFRARATGSSAVSYTTTTEAAVLGKTTNAIGSTSGSTITVTAPAANTPTMTPAPTPTPTTVVSATPSPTPAQTPVTGDLTGDGKVGIVDYTLFMSAWMLDNIAVADLNGDGRKSAIDYTIFMNAWNDSH